MRGTQFAEFSVFVAVAEQASFTKAAKRLGRSTATLSQTIRALEDRLGVRLLNRTTRSVALTDAGERLMKQLRPLFDAFDDAVESVNAFRDKPAGHLRLLTPPLAAEYVIGPVLADFLSEYPEISLDISVGLTTDLAAGNFDAGFWRGDRIARNMAAVRVTEDVHLAAVAAPDYLARHGTPVMPSDLHAHDCIRLRYPSGEFFPWEFRVGEKVVEFEVDGSIVVNDAELVVGAALEGLGIAYTFHQYAGAMIADGRLVRVLEDSAPPPLEGVFMYYPKRAKNPAALDALVDFLRANIRTRRGFA